MKTNDIGDVWKELAGLSKEKIQDALVLNWNIGHAGSGMSVKTFTIKLEVDDNGGLKLTDVAVGASNERRVLQVLKVFSDMGISLKKL